MQKYINHSSNYDKAPALSINGDFKVWDQWHAIVEKLIEHAKLNSQHILIDCYPGVNEDELVQAIEKYFPQLSFFNVADAAKPISQINKMIAKNLTDDRVFGVLSSHQLLDFYDHTELERLKKLKKKLKESAIFYGWGAGLLAKKKDIVVLADMSRWEIQQRMREGMPNWRCDNDDEDILRKYKRGYFVEWRVADRHKKEMFERIDYLLDTNIPGQPKMINGKAFREGLKQAAKQPFRVVPFFDPGVWGGQWMKNICNLKKGIKNFAWCFDCVPEENSLLFKINNHIIEIPSIDLVFYQPKKLLGEKIYSRFGAEFPIRFDLLDTIEGQNLSLQVHPLTEYIQKTFGMHYTQDESYYILDVAERDPCVYLGLKNGVKKEQLMRALRDAQKSGKFDDAKFINRFPTKKHDHFSIPAGTIHCSGKDTIVLEISATPYIFTFKLWDWGRLGLDGKPRPVHLEHGEKVIQFNRDTEWVKQNLIDQIKVIKKDKGWIEEKTGLHQKEFIETRRHWFSVPIEHDTHGTVNVLNLVEGEEAVVTSPHHQFKPFIVHYAETFIIPATVGKYIISPHGSSKGKKIATIKAYVRGTEK